MNSQRREAHGGGRAHQLRKWVGERRVLYDVRSEGGWLAPTFWPFGGPWGQASAAPPRLLALSGRRSDAHLKELEETDVGKESRSGGDSSHTADGHSHRFGNLM